jgi:CheY-like chemotaxis protein
MGGTLSVESELGKGSCFTLRVPVRLLDADEVAAVAAASDASEATPQAAQSQEQHAKADATAVKLEQAAQRRRAKGAEEAAQPPQPRVLVADDHPLNLRLISRLLQLQGFDITAVADGGAALEALTEAGTVPFDLAVLDMNMPIISGPEACAAYRQWEAARGAARCDAAAHNRADRQRAGGARGRSASRTGAWQGCEQCVQRRSKHAASSERARSPH